MRRGMPVGWKHALQPLLAGDRLREERIALAGTGVGADARLASGGGGKPPWRPISFRGWTDGDNRGSAGALGVAVSIEYVAYLQCLAAYAAFALPSRPVVWGAPGVQIPDLVLIALLCDSCPEVDSSAANVCQ